MKLLKSLILQLFHKLGYDIIPYGRGRYEKLLKTQAAVPQTMDPKHAEVRRIQYGCGPNYLLGWLNVDLHAQTGQGYLSAAVDVTGRHPFPDGHFEYGFAEDLVEHLGQAEQIIFLCEVFRTLKKGGVLRLSFPGLEGVLKRHYDKPEYQTAVLAKYEAYERWGHLHFPSRRELEAICKHIGFSEMCPVEYGISVHDELKNLDTRTDQIGLNTYVEIVK